VARGKIHPDGSVEFASPTCYPTVQPAGCPVDNVLQMKSVIAVKPYTRTIHGVSRSYMTTAPTCPAARVWRMPIRLWWADGSVDTVVVEEPCTRPRSPRRCSRKQRARHRRSCRRASRRRHR
jgi:hypothetical protein